MTVTNRPRARDNNQLLRRVDWRFLLSDPNPRKSICFAHGLLAEAVALISDQLVKPDHSPLGDCDLAVAVNPDSSTLQKAWAALYPGGICYSEWHSPLMGGPDGVRRRLQAAGFTDITCYWTWPWPDQGSPLFWLPIEVPEALHYFLTSRPHALSMMLRARNKALQILWRIGLRARLIVPICVTARKPGAVESNVDANLLDTIRTEWSAWGLGAIPACLSWLFLTGGLSSLNKVVGLLFADSDSQPRLIVKWPRIPESIPALAQEAKTLQTINALRPEGMPGVPRVIFFHECDNQTALGETVLRGQPLFTLLRPNNYRNLALKVTDWLANLAGHAPPCSRSDWWNRLIEKTFTDFEQSFGVILDSGQLDETRVILSTLEDLPLVCEHRDCSPWNVLVGEDGELAFLDWESAETCGLPALDLIYFLTYLAFFMDGAMETDRFRDSYRTALNPATFTGQVQVECEQRYCERIGLDPAALRPLRLLVWLIHSKSEYKRFLSEAGGRPTPTALRCSLFVTLWEEELQHISAAMETGA